MFSLLQAQKNMNYKLLLFLLLLFTSCSMDNDLFRDSSLSDYDNSVIDYFKEVALGFEFGNGDDVTRRWTSELRIFVGGVPNLELMDELKIIKEEINDLATNGFKINIVLDSSKSNYYLYFGNGSKYAKLFPNQSDLVISNWGLFSVFWNGQNQFTSGHMYVDVIRANLTAQKHLLREELTQSLGLGRDSPLYSESIFQSGWTTTTEYADIDKDLIRLLYHPKMALGMDEKQVESVLKEILLSE